MNRTIEKVLAMIASILNVFGIAGTVDDAVDIPMAVV